MLSGEFLEDIRVAGHYLQDIGGPRGNINEISLVSGDFREDIRVGRLDIGGSLGNIGLA